MNTRIIGTGRCVPKKRISNDDLANVLDTSDEWISTRTGIRNRYVAQEETTSMMAGEAAVYALESARMQADSIDAIIVATSSPDNVFPSVAATVQASIGAVNAFCFDVSSACTGFIQALNIADSYIQSGMCENVLVIGSERMSSEVNWRDRSVCVLFGDGAGAAILSGERDDNKEDFRQVCSMHSDGMKGNVLTSGKKIRKDNNSTECTVENIQMSGQEVFKFAVKKVPESIREVVDKAGIELDDVSTFVLHQANLRIIESVAKRLGVDIKKFPVNLSEYGNTSAASIPILLDELNRDNKLNKGDYLILSGFGAGLSWGSTLLKW